MFSMLQASNQYRNYFWTLFFCSFLFKILLALTLPLAADESYYWVWSHHLQLSYFDHPPMIAYLLWLSHPLENLGFAIRLPTVIIGHLTLLVWAIYLRNKLTDHQIFYFALLLLFSPLTGLGSILATPDVPFCFFWALSLLFLDKIINKKPSILWYSLFGISLGLGFLSKYHIVLFLLFLLTLIWRQSDVLKSIRWSYSLFTISLGLLICSPVLIWNYQNNWASFLFQINHGLGRDGWIPEWTLSYVLAQTLFIWPFFIPEIIKTFRNKNSLALSSQFLSQFGFFLYTSFKSVVEANWPVAGFAPTFALISSSYISKKKLYSYIFFWTAISLILLSHWLWAWLPPDDRRDETHQYRSLSHFVQNYAPLYANCYQMASLLTFETKKSVPKLRGMSRYDFYDELSESQPKTSHFYLLRRSGQNLPDWISLTTHKIEIIEKASPNFELVLITSI